MTTPTPLALHTIIHTVQRGFEKHFSARTFRCQAEVMQIKIHKSRVYIDLVEYDPAGTVLAKARAIIRERELLDHYLHVIGLSLAEELIGHVMMFQAHCTFHAQRGLSLTVDALSHEFGRGQLRQLQQQIIQTLQTEGIYDANKQQLLAPRPLHLAIISSANSEGLRDFLSIIDASPYQITRELFPASVHGESAKKEVTTQLTRIASLSEKEFTAVVITRGGGGGEGLARQNDLDVARAICLLPLPCILATGHTGDTSVLDEIVRHAAKTPSDAAHQLLGYPEMISAALENRYAEITGSITEKKQYYRSIIDQYYEEITTAIGHSQQRITKNIEHRWESISLVSPYKQLAHGYAILQDTQGKYLGHTGVEKLGLGDQLVLKIYAHEFVVEIKEKRSSTP